jgi:prophage DNA circulation protein
MQAQTLAAVAIIKTQTTLKARSSSSLTSGITGVVNNLNEFTRNVQKLTGQIQTIIDTPDTLSYSLGQLVSSLSNMTATPREAYDGFVAMFSSMSGYFGKLSFLATDIGTTEQANSNVLRDSLLSSIVCAAALVAITIDFVTNADAYGIRDSITSMIDTVLENCVDDNVFSSLSDLRTAVSESIPPPGEELADITTYAVADTVPSLVVAHEIYGDIDNEQDIIDRNSITNPWAVPGGKTLEVLL